MMISCRKPFVATLCLLTLSAKGQEVRNDTITDKTHQLREVTITESRRQHEVTSTAPLHILDREQMLTLGVTDVADALQCVTINGAQGLTLEVVSLTGRLVKTVKIESPAQRIELNVPKGCYILKIGKVVRKVAVR